MDNATITVEFLPSGKTVKAVKGSALLDIAESAGIHIGIPCGGKGRCGKCKVVFEEGAPDSTPTEEDTLTEADIAQGYRLGCQTHVGADAVVYVPDGVQGAKILTIGTARVIPFKPAITKRFVKIPEPTVHDQRSDLTRVLTAFELSERVACDLAAAQKLSKEMREDGYGLTGVFSGGVPIAFEGGDTTSDCYGVAFDIGTTTIAAYLLDLNTGKQQSVAASVNPQNRVGDDVISRINHTMQESGGLAELQSLVIAEMNRLVETLCHGAEISADSVYEAAVAGNTCMMHLFMGINPIHLAQAPYVPAVSAAMYISARDVGLKISEFGRIHALPCIAGYVGADTVAVILATDMYEDDRLTLAVDIGTNGEIALGSQKRMLACSTAAGPAFEGAHIKHGMRAASGAIDAVWFDECELKYTTIGGAEPVGICGSGLLDAISCLINAGIIESSGRIVDSEEIPEEYSHLRSKLVLGERGNEFILAEKEYTSISEPVVITQRDVREIQLAKGAIAAGIQTLMDNMGVTADDLDRVVLAGAFGNYVRKESAINVGMLPNVPISKLHSVGNAAGEGAKLALISTDARGDADCIADRIEYVELTTDPGFQDRFAEALMFGED